MTVEEKVGQLGVFADMVRPFAPDVNPEANAQCRAGAGAGARGQVGCCSTASAPCRAARSSSVATEESRLGIPLLFAADVIHGMRTVFPIPLAEAASFEPQLAERTARATAVEATAAGIHWTFAPMVDIARDQRWGRGRGRRRGRGAGLRVRRRPRARLPGRATCRRRCAAGHAQALRRLRRGDGRHGIQQVDISGQTLRDVHLPPFKAAFDAGAITVMSSFNDINGVPASANRRLLTDMLRGEWQFPGVVVSDYTADMELIAHGYAADARDATPRRSPPAWT
jgi:beta-glucosidase